MIWVIGGGPRSYQICQYLKQTHKAFKLTTITDYKRDMPLSYTSKALSRPLDEAEISEFIKKEEIGLIIDHSYGNAITRQLIAQCEANHIIYIRYEEAADIDQIMDEKIKVITDLGEASNLLEDKDNTIFIDLNRKAKKELELFNLKNCIYKEETDTANLQAAFKTHHIAMAIVQESESLPSYIEVCKALGILLIIMRKNKIKYPIRCMTLSDLEGHLQLFLNSGNIK